MFFTIALVLFAAWLLGLINSYTFGGAIHILLAIAIVMVVIDAVLARRKSPAAPKPLVSSRRSARLRRTLPR